MNHKTVRDRVLYFAFGLLTAAILTFLLGATYETHGRYQIAAWSAARVGYGAYIVDTATGETKIVYQDTGYEHPKIDHLHKSFGEIP